MIKQKYLQHIREQLEKKGKEVAKRHPDMEDRAEAKKHSFIKMPTSIYRELVEAVNPDINSEDGIEVAIAKSYKATFMPSGRRGVDDMVLISLAITERLMSAQVKPSSVPSVKKDKDIEK